MIKFLSKLFKPKYHEIYIKYNGKFLDVPYTEFEVSLKYRINLEMTQVQESGWNGFGWPQWSWTDLSPDKNKAFIDKLDTKDGTYFTVIPDKYAEHVKRIR